MSSTLSYNETVTKLGERDLTRKSNVLFRINNSSIYVHYAVFSHPTCNYGLMAPTKVIYYKEKGSHKEGFGVSGSLLTGQLMSSLMSSSIYKCDAFWTTHIMMRLLRFAAWCKSLREKEKPLQGNVM